MYSEFFICRKSPILTYPPAFGASICVTPFEFCRDLRHHKTSSVFK